MSAVESTRIRDAEGYALDAHRWNVLWVVSLGALMSILDSTVVNIALPKLMNVFSADVHRAQWILTGYLLALAIVIPLTGYLDETFGGKRVYILTLALFTGASALCGLSWSLEALILFRILQGLGGGLLMPLGMSMVLREFPPSERGTALSLIGIPLMLGPALGPTFGGFLVEYVDWRLIFYINVPIGIVTMILAWRILHDAPTDRDQSLDVPGILLAAIGNASLLLGIDNGPTDGWGSTWVVAELVIGVLCLAAFVVVELRAQQPLLELRLFRIVNFSTAIFVTLIVQIGLFGATFLLPVFLQNLRGLGAMQTGMLLIPQAITVALVMPISGRIFDRFGPTVILVPGLALLTFATYLFTNLNLNTSDRTIIELLILRGIGMGLSMMPAQTAAMNAIPRAQIPRATALTNTLQRIAGSFGTAIMATVLTSRQNLQFATLSQTMTPFSPGVQLAMAHVRQMMALYHLPAAMSQQLTTLMVYQSVQITATVRAFDDTFYVSALICLPAILAALLVRNTRTGLSGRPMMMAE
ncbi:MAG: DHA2 family efflux MFS transporter permease subunit [Chloroflexi bacterium]|nr:DHA2 family efflux MFS transporter permease subunit [Chloroflexota bacterium]